jgi:hypothetical protein
MLLLQLRRRTGAEKTTVHFVLSSCHTLLPPGKVLDARTTLQSYLCDLRNESLLDSSWRCCRRLGAPISIMMTAIELWSLGTRATFCTEILSAKFSLTESGTAV